MTHSRRIVTTVAVLATLVLCMPVQAQTPEIDALRARAEQGDADAQFALGVAYADGLGVPQDDVQAHMWFNLVASRLTGTRREEAVESRNIVAGLMTPDQLAEARRLAREWDTAHPRQLATVRRGGRRRL